MSRTYSNEPGCTAKDNRRRIRTASKAVRSYPAFEKEDLQSSAVDLVADVLTWAEYKGLSVTDILRMAYEHYKAEGGTQ